ncbi:MAG TPA: dienelactone hydrolase family protein [Candidatus Eremiobacteraceae bacterium]|nr:dienelactone hydrolase family protein [Candidatus Eremiobacteraceae bacterium]
MRLKFVLAITAFGASMLVGAQAAWADYITIPATASTKAMPAYLVRPSGPGPYPAIVVVHGCDGFGTMEKGAVDELGGLGYVALGIDTNTPQGIKVTCGNVAAYVVSTQYAAAALAWLAQQAYVAPKRLGMLGYSSGSIEILNLIDPLSGPQPAPAGVRAAVAYYPGCRGRDGNISVPLLILDGSADDWLPSAPCQAMVQNAAGLGKDAEITTYPGATHAFNDPVDGTIMVHGHTVTYDPSAAADANAKMKAFFAKYLESSP